MKNREIKFRGWHIQKKIMFSAERMEKDQLTLLTTGNFINVSGISTQLSVIYPKDKFIPLQYTGLKDKEGKEIYEGDIVNVRRYNEKKWEVGKVIWDNYFHAIKCKYSNTPKSGTYGIRWEEVTESEIIGNIYENPKLLS